MVSADNMADEQGFLTHLVTLVLGGGGVGSAWAYATRRRELDTDRVARFEERLMSEYERTQEALRATQAEQHRIADLYRDEKAARVRATEDLERAEAALTNALHRVSTLEGELRDTRALVTVLDEQNALLRRRLREHGDELGGERSDASDKGGAR